MPSSSTLKLLALALALAFVTSGAWYVRGLKADRDMAAFKEGLRQQQDDQRALAMKVEAADVQNTKESTARVDEQEKTRGEEVRYVDREVVKYVTKYRDRACQLPGEWVCLYNQSLGLPCGVPEAGATGAKADGGSVPVPASNGGQ
jgi:hypothetical protein